MFQIIAIFGILTALNIGFGTALSEKSAVKDGAVDIETVIEE